jgi:hypothetical protein
VKNSIPRKSSLGFSIVPPPGSDWYETHKDDSLMYVKKTHDKGYLIYTKATEIHLAADTFKTTDFMEYVRNIKELELEDSRYRNVSFELDSERSLSPNCARYTLKYEDRGPANTQDSSTFAALENSGLYCMHPDTPGVGIDMFYVERRTKGLRGMEPTSYRREGQQFLDGLEFQQLNES